MRKKENIALIVPPGTGKTHLAIALNLKAITQGYKVLFTTVNEMLEELYLSIADNSFRQKLRYYTSFDLLILDKLGLKKLNQNSVDDFYDPVLATAILDRFIHYCHFVVIKGESYRMKQLKGSIKAASQSKS